MSKHIGLGSVYNFINEIVNGVSIVSFEKFLETHRINLSYGTTIYCVAFITFGEWRI